MSFVLFCALLFHCLRLEKRKIPKYNASSYDEPSKKRRGIDKTPAAKRAKKIVDDASDDEANMNAEDEEEEEDENEDKNEDAAIVSQASTVVMSGKTRSQNKEFAPPPTKTTQGTFSDDEEDSISFSQVCVLLFYRASFT
jgi:hypothetical protein